MKNLEFLPPARGKARMGVVNCVCAYEHPHSGNCSCVALPSAIHGGRLPSPLQGEGAIHDKNSQFFTIFKSIDWWRTMR